MLDFYRTPGGRKFIDATVPELARQLKRLADATEGGAKLAAEIPTRLCDACHQQTRHVDLDDHNHCTGCRESFIAPCSHGDEVSLDGPDFGCPNCVIGCVHAQIEDLSLDDKLAVLRTVLADTIKG